MPNPYQAFDAYGLRHLPAHLIDSQQWDRLADVLTDLYFIEAKCAAGMTYKLIADYAAALDALPEAQEKNKIKRERETRVQKYIQDLIAYSKSEIDKFEVVSSIEPWEEEQIKEGQIYADIERIKINPTRLDRVQAFAQFVNAESHILVKFAVHSGFVIQHAYNSANSGPVASAAESLLNEMNGILLLQASSMRPEYNPYPVRLKTIEGEFEIVCPTLDGKRVLSASQDRILQIQDLDSGECLYKLTGHTDTITTISVTPDGKRAISGSKDTTLRVWDLRSGICLHTLTGHISEVQDVHITPDGERAVSGSVERVGFQTLRIWDLERGICLKTITSQYDGPPIYSYAATFSTPVMEISITPDGTRAVSTAGFVCVWDLKQGVCLHQLSSTNDSIVRITPDGKRIISGGSSIFLDYSSVDDSIQVWNFESGECLYTLTGHTRTVVSMAVTLDSRYVVSSDTQTIRLWDLESGVCLRTLTGHIKAVGSSSITPDGRCAVSWGYDQTVRVWDLERGLCLRIFEDVGKLEDEKNSRFKKVLIMPNGTRSILWESHRNNFLHLLDLEHGVDRTNRRL